MGWLTRWLTSYPTIYDIDVVESIRGRYRFTIRDVTGKLVALSGPAGYDSAAVCETDAKRLLGHTRVRNVTHMDSVTLRESKKEEEKSDD